MVNINDFKYNSEYSWYESKLEINGISTNLYVSDDEIEDIEMLNNRVDRGIYWFKNNYETILDYCADNLLEFKNDTWLDPEKEEKVTKQEFKDRLELEAIEITYDGGLEIWFID